MTQLALPFDTAAPDLEETEAAINRLVRELLAQTVYARMQASTVDPADGNLFVRMDTVLGITQINAQWSMDPEWVEHFNDIFYDYQCCDRMEEGHLADSDHYLILDLDVSVWHNGEEIGRDTLGGVSLGWVTEHGGPDRMYLAQTLRDMVLNVI